MRISFILLFCFIILIPARLNAVADNVVVTNLRCEYQVNPLGIDVFRPRLSWVLETEQRGQKQSSYQVLAAGSAESLARNEGDLWDTGKQDSEQSIHIEYAGKPLASKMRCYWKVRVWDKDGVVSAWSEAGLWSMGLLEKGDWQASWIWAPKAKERPLSVEPSPMFRKVFTLGKPVKRGTVNVSGLGYYELYVNGGKIGDHVLDPAFTRYDRRILYPW